MSLPPLWPKVTDLLLLDPNHVVFNGTAESYMIVYIVLLQYNQLILVIHLYISNS
jgi:hypothetical protein